MKFKEDIHYRWLTITLFRYLLYHIVFLYQRSLYQKCYIQPSKMKLIHRFQSCRNLAFCPFFEIRDRRLSVCASFSKISQFASVQGTNALSSKYRFLDAIEASDRLFIRFKNKFKPSKMGLVEDQGTLLKYFFFSEKNKILAKKFFYFFLFY